MRRFLSWATFRKILGLAIVLGFLLFLFIIGTNRWIKNSTAKHLYSDAQLIPNNEVGLLLGTVRTLASGYENQYFTYRIRAAAELYHSSKIKHVIVSGDNHKKSYNEPEDMKQALMELGVPEKAITLDFAGFRTLDSVIRCKEEFQQESFTVISQPFHNQRAVFIARKHKINAIGYNAQDVGAAYGRKTRFRELFAKTKAVIDVYLLNKQPKFLGPKIDINQ